MLVTGRLILVMRLYPIVILINYRGCSSELIGCRININMPNNDSNIEFHIQTNGGAILPTLPIVDLIKTSPIPINTYIEGYCASAGTLLSVVGNKRYMRKNSLLIW